MAHANASHAAAPTGGAAKAGWGCLLSFFIATHALAAELPSGLTAELHEVLVDQVGADTYVRFRFTAPDLPGVGYAEIEGDFPHLCATLALPYLRDYALTADKIVISVADRIVEFGTTDAQATQYFEQFRAENGACIWEGF